MPEPAESLAPPIRVLRQFGLEADAVEAISSGRVNQHWRVSAGGETFVLRRYTRLRQPAGVAWEHELLRHAAAKGWPVAVPLPADDGALLVTLDADRYALFPFLRGETMRFESLSGKRIKGRLLARLHDDLADFPLEGQRPGSGRAWELDAFVELAGAGSFNQLLARFGHEHRALAATIRSQRYRSLRELSRLGYGEEHVGVVHCDFHNDNLLFEAGRLTGMLDFDSAHRDMPAYDLAASLGLECLAAPDFDALDLRAVEAFVGGYTQHRRLGEAELALLPALVRAHLLWFSAFRLVQWHVTGAERAVASLARTVKRRFPAFEHTLPELAAVLQAAAR